LLGCLVLRAPSRCECLFSPLFVLAAGMLNCPVTPGLAAVPRAAVGVPPSWLLFPLVSGYPPGWNRVIFTGPLCVILVTGVCANAGRDFCLRGE
jgi:hypothetical protein